MGTMVPSLFHPGVQFKNVLLGNFHGEDPTLTNSTLSSSVSHQQLRCDVIIDVIDNIYLETTTHELYLDDSPEEFLIRARNQDGGSYATNLSMNRVV